jgi:predicted nucleic acid-binding protein
LKGWLLDTNVVSELRKPRPDAQVRAFVAAQPVHLLHLSTITFAEIRYGIERLTDAARRQDIALWLARTLRPLFADRTLAVEEDVVLRWRQMLEAGGRRGHTFSQPDLFVAALAALKDLIVVSRDTGEFVAGRGAGARSLERRLHAGWRPCRRTRRTRSGRSAGEDQLQALTWPSVSAALHFRDDTRRLSRPAILSTACGAKPVTRSRVRAPRYRPRLTTRPPSPNSST